MLSYIPQAYERILLNILILVLTRFQNLLHDEPPVSVIRKALGSVAHARLECLYRHFRNIDGRRLLRYIGHQHLYNLVLHLVAQVHRLHVLANVAEGLQACVPEISIRLRHVGLRAQRRNQLVPLIAWQLDAGNGCQNA